MSKTEKYKPATKKKPHPKKYTDPIEDLDTYIQEELDDSRESD